MLKKDEVIDLLNSGNYKKEYKECEKKEYKECEPINASKKAVYKFASDVARQCEDMSTKSRDLSDMFEIVSAFGGRVHTLSLSDYDWSEMSGSIFIQKKKDFDVIIPEYTGPIRDRFTLAHELGHYLLHSKAGEKENLWAARMGSGRLEWEANWFAAAFLIPTYKLKDNEERLKKYKRESEDLLEEISTIFRVSIEAAEFRWRTYCENTF